MRYFIEQLLLDCRDVVLYLTTNFMGIVPELFLISGMLLVWGITMVLTLGLI